MNRNRLPSRRGHVSFTFEHGIMYTAGLGFFEDGSLAEIFLNGAKADSDLDIAARDAAVATSIALQYGASPAVLFRSMTRNPDGSPQSPIGVVLKKFLDHQI